MQPVTFAITHFTQMLEKARRELERFKASPDLDHALNYCMTIYHVYDYAKLHFPHTTKAEKKALHLTFAPMFSDPDFDVCHRVCNQAKHVELTNTNEYLADSSLGTTSGAMLGHFVLGTEHSMLGTGPRPILIVDGKEVEFVPLAERVLVKWEQFLRTNGLLA